MGINRKSRQLLENKLVVKCSRLNFYIKRELLKQGKRQTRQSEELLKSGPCGCEAANWGEESEGGGWLLRRRIRGQKHYRWMGQISVLLLTQPDTCAERLSLFNIAVFFFGLFSWQRLVKWTRLFRLEFNDCSSSYASSSLFCEFCLKAAQSSCKTVGSPSAVLEACSNVNNCSCLTQPLTPEPLGLLKLLIHLSIEKCVFLGGSRIVHRSC